MEEGKSLLRKMADMFSDALDDEEDVAHEILTLAQEAKEQGKIRASELELLKNVFSFEEKNVKDIMTHRKRILALDEDETLEDALVFILEQGNTRYPVYEGDIDNVKGILHLKDAMRYYLKERNHKMKLKDLKGCVRKAMFVPETRSIAKLLRQMQTGHTHMVVVLDEYGQTSGIVAMEDIIEELVGNILDEYDREEKFIVRRSDGTYVVQGTTELDELSKVLQIKFEFEEEEYETLNGFLIYKLERIPTEEEKLFVEYGGYRFEILSMDDNMIQDVRVIRL